MELPGDCENFYKLNCLPLLRIVEKELEGWHKGIFSWLGRSNAIKQNILPRVLYLISAMPIDIPKVIFTKLQSMINKLYLGPQNEKITV